MAAQGIIIGVIVGEVADGGIEVLARLQSEDAIVLLMNNCFKLGARG